MEEIDSTKIYNATTILISSQQSVDVIKNILIQNGLSDRELQLAEAMAKRNIFYYTFCRRWNPEGFMEAIPETPWEA